MVDALLLRMLDGKPSLADDGPTIGDSILGGGFGEGRRVELVRGREEGPGNGFGKASAAGSGKSASMTANP